MPEGEGWRFWRRKRPVVRDADEAQVRHVQGHQEPADHGDRLRIGTVESDPLLDGSTGSHVPEDGPNDRSRKR